MSEVTRHRPWGDSVPIEFVTASDYDQLKADSEVVAGLVESRLAENLRLKAENERLKLRLWDLEHSEVDHVLKERDTLRKQLDEANSAYARLADGVPAAMAKYHKCKKQLDEARELLVEPQRFPSSKWADKWQVQRDAWLEKTK